MGMRWREMGRLRKIAAVLLRHGLGHLVDRLGLTGRARKGETPKEEVLRLSEAERVRMALEELGPTFVKFGQVMSLRSDNLPDGLIVELKKLQDAVPPFPVEKAKEAIRAEFGSPVEELYGSFNDVPLAAASIAQVHRATLKDGTEVIVKVQRPGIEEIIKTDLGIMRTLAHLVEKRVAEYRQFDPVGLVDEFEKSITKELDFITEARSAERFRTNFKDDTRVCVPAVIEPLTKRRVLTATFSTGRKVTDLREDPAPYRQETARRINDLYLIQILEHGFFHADPHPGNIFVMADGSICFHDFGIVGELDERTREAIADLFIAFVEMDLDGIADTYLGMGVISEEIDRDGFKRDIGEFIRAYYWLPMKDFSFAEVMKNLILIGKRYKVKVKRELLLLGKTFMGVESIVRGLDPDFNLVENIKPFAGSVMARQLLPSLSRKDMYKGLRDLNRFIRDLPADASRVIRELKEKGLELKLKHENLEEFGVRIDRASNRLSFSLIIAAIIIGSSIIMQLHIGPSVSGVPLLGAAGYIIALVLGLWLVWSIFRSGRL